MTLGFVLLAVCVYATAWKNDLQDEKIRQLQHFSRVYPAPSPPPHSSPPRAERSRPLVWVTPPLNWRVLAMCESTDRPGALSDDGKYRGLYQFDARTWAAVGGHGDPARASRSEQTLRAQLLYDDRGEKPWPVCGRRLHDH